MQLSKDMENDLHTVTLCRDDWQLVVDALRVVQYTYNADAIRIGAESTYGAVLADEAAKRQCIADDIEFFLP